jgi:hypothetical protein
MKLKMKKMLILLTLTMITSCGVSRNEMVDSRQEVLNYVDSSFDDLKTEEWIRDVLNGMITARYSFDPKQGKGYIVRIDITRSRDISDTEQEHTCNVHILTFIKGTDKGWQYSEIGAKITAANNFEQLGVVDFTSDPWERVDLSQQPNE